MQTNCWRINYCVNRRIFERLIKTGIPFRVIDIVVGDRVGSRQSAERRTTLLATRLESSLPYMETKLIYLRTLSLFVLMFVPIIVFINFLVFGHKTKAMKDKISDSTSNTIKTNEIFTNSSEPEGYHEIN